MKQYKIMFFPCTNHMCNQFNLMLSHRRYSSFISHWSSNYTAKRYDCIMLKSSTSHTYALLGPVFEIVVVTKHAVFYNIADMAIWLMLLVVIYECTITNCMYLHKWHQVYIETRKIYLLKIVVVGIVFVFRYA